MDPDRTSAPFSLYWGDLHKHLTGPGAPLSGVGEKLGHAREHLDFCAAYCYPFTHYEQGDGLTVESVGGRPAFDEWWATVQAEAARHNDPGTFVTFPAYEWHGDRRRWGDHHVIYREEGHPLDDTPDVRELMAALRERPALLVPHHTAYRIGERGKDWDVHDPDLSPVMEVYSTHGSSEGVDTPVPMAFNRSMGPRTDGGTFQDAIDRGRRVGVIASNDGPGVPGAWNRGLAGVWAETLTREGLWEAIAARRTYASTGDRIALWWTLGDAPMGSTVPDPGGDPTEATVEIDCPRPLDRIELLRNGRVIETYSHPRNECSNPIDLPAVVRLPIAFGWGPTREYAPFAETDVDWTGTIHVENGVVRDIAPRFVGPGQAVDVIDGGDRCRFSLLTGRDEPATALPEGVHRSVTQGLILEIDASSDATLRLDLDEMDDVTVRVSEALERAQVIPQYDVAATLLEEVGVPEDELGNLDRRYHLAPKVNVHRAYPVTACSARVSFSVDVRSDDCLYVRGNQIDGQYVWGSPIWVD